MIVYVHAVNKSGVPIESLNIFDAVLNKVSLGVKRFSNTSNSPSCSKGYSALAVGLDEVIALIEQLRAQYRQSELLQVFSVSRSSVDYRCRRMSQVNPERERLQGLAQDIHTASRGAAGTRTISGQLKQQCESVGRYKASHLMKEAKLVSKQQKQHRYRAVEEGSVIAPNTLNREFIVAEVNQVWCGDVTYVWTGPSWLYLVVVLDLYKPHVVGRACSRHPDSVLTIQALRMTYESRDCSAGVMFHSDQGCHYSSKAFRQQLWRYRAEQSMSRRGNCWDNAPMERFFRSDKSEWMPENGYQYFTDAEPGIAQYMKYYNHDRGHSMNDYLSPAQAEAA